MKRSFHKIFERCITIFKLNVHFKIAELLVNCINKKSLEKSIGPNTLSNLVNAKTTDRQTPLILACSHNHYSLIECLVDKAEAFINASDNHGNTAISHILMGIESEIMKIPRKNESDDSEIYDVIYYRHYLFILMDIQISFVADLHGAKKLGFGNLDYIPFSSQRMLLDWCWRVSKLGCWWTTNKPEQ